MSGLVDFEEVDISEDFSPARQYGVQSTPTFVILGRDGAVFETLVGGQEKSELKALLEKAAEQ